VSISNNFTNFNREVSIPQTFHGSGADSPSTVQQGAGHLPTQTMKCWKGSLSWMS